ncbi:MAG: hypothetical protein KJ623_01125, partial [Nanoarchaeota archaeon]|nr:hypothetical protein [Nanoarchaeota archaeon]
MQKLRPLNKKAKTSGLMVVGIIAVVLIAIAVVYLAVTQSTKAEPEPGKPGADCEIEPYIDLVVRDKLNAGTTVAGSG